MRILVLALALLLVIATAVGCAGEQLPSSNQTSLERATQDITGGTWESSDEGGDALFFRPNGTGQGYVANLDATAELLWSIEIENGHAVLTWNYIDSPPEKAREWVVVVDGDIMYVWPRSGSRVLLDPDVDEPVILERTD